MAWEYCDISQRTCCLKLFITYIKMALPVGELSINQVHQLFDFCLLERHATVSIVTHAVYDKQFMWCVPFIQNVLALLPSKTLESVSLQCCCCNHVVTLPACDHGYERYIVCSSAQFCYVATETETSEPSTIIANSGMSPYMYAASNSNNTPSDASVIPEPQEPEKEHVLWTVTDTTESQSQSQSLLCNTLYLCNEAGTVQGCQDHKHILMSVIVKDSS